MVWADATQMHPTGGIQGLIVAGGPGHAGGTTSPSCTAGDSKETAEQLCVPSYLMDNRTEHWFNAAIGYCSN